MISQKYSIDFEECYLYSSSSFDRPHSWKTSLL